MNNLKDIADRIESRLEEKDQVREVTIKSTRAINRLSGSIIHSIHKGENVSS
ncbi:MAG: translin family protein, partial [Euryarchaeota archaeon]|nr:translin family protein [Euryarchaeota archaeon]